MYVSKYGMRFVFLLCRFNKIHKLHAMNNVFCDLVIYGLVFHIAMYLKSIYVNGVRLKGKKSDTNIDRIRQRKISEINCTGN